MVFEVSVTTSPTIFELICHFLVPEIILDYFFELLAASVRIKCRL